MAEEILTETSQEANPLLTLLLGGTSNTSSTPTYSEYIAWAGDASADGKISKKEAREMFGKNWRRARKAVKNGNSRVLNNLTKPFTRLAYIKDGKLYIQGDKDYSDADYDAAEYKGDDQRDVVKKYNQAVLDWRKNATITYRKGEDGKYHYYAIGKFGSFDLPEVDITESGWLEQPRKESSQLNAFGKAVDAAGMSYSDETSLLKDIGYDSSKIKDFDKKTNEEQQTIQDDISMALTNHYNKLLGDNSWDNAVTADAWKSAVINYYNNNHPKWLSAITWDPSSRYYRYTHGTTSSNTNAGDAIGLHQQGGTLRERALLKHKHIKNKLWQ